jgi:NADPH2:quinone reductase
LNIVQLPIPTPGTGEVRVKVAWSGVNPSDVKARAGLRTRELEFPRIIPHSDGAGVIDAVGPGVSPVRRGERVWLWNAAWGRPCGTAAEYVIVPAAQAVRLPENVDLAVGACLGIPAMTAYHAARVDGGVAGKSVLIAGGAGAVGHYAIQFSRLMGAKRVFSTVSSSEKGALALLAGADAVLNYKSEDFLAQLQEVTGARGVDRIIEVDIAHNLPTDLQVLNPDGDIIAYGSGAAEATLPFYPMVLKNARVRFFIVYNLRPVAREQAIDHLTALLERGSLIHNIGARLPLERIAEAHELLEKGRAIGNVILQS